MRKIIISTNTQKTLDFFLQRPEEEYTAKEVQRSTGISKSGINLALRELAKNGFINRKKRDKIYLFSLVHSDPVVRQMKVLRTVLLLNGLLNKLRKYSEQIILFGSCARGEDISTSDVDLFVLTRQKGEVRKVLEDTKLARTVQSIVRTPVECSEMKIKEKVFYDEIARGINLWEAV